jgi:hypothetical protein
VDETGAEVAAALRGARPEPLLARLAAVCERLLHVAEGAGRALDQTNTAITTAAQVGAGPRTETPTTSAGPTMLPGMPDTKSPISRPAQVPAEAGRFDAAVAAGVPPYGARGDKTTGVLVLFDGRVLAPQDSGYDGPALRLPKPRPGMDRTLVTHVEAHAVAAMRENGSRNATLYLNKVPCVFPHPGNGRPWGCENALERMLHPNETLTVYGPGGYVRIFHGKAEAG